MKENKESIEALLPEISLIKDEELRQKTIEIWWEAIKEGGWRVADLERIPFTLLISGTEINLITHVRAVTLCSLRLAETIEHFYPGVISVNRDILLAGAILHDVGKLLEIQEKDGKFIRSHSGKLLRHPISGATLASRFGLPPEIIHIIAGHSKEGDSWKRTLEAIIIHHADFVNFDILSM